MSIFFLDVGLIDKITKHQKMSTLEARKMIEKIVSSYGNIYNIYEGERVSKKDDGSIFNENILKLEFPDITKEKVIEIMESIIMALNIEGILLYEQIGEAKRKVC